MVQKIQANTVTSDRKGKGVIMKTVIVNVNLEYAFDVASDEQAGLQAENIELPAEYVSDSFEIVKVLDGNQTVSQKVTEKVI